MNKLNLTLKRQWYDMILSGEKTEEYREIKPYFKTRLCNKKYHFVHCNYLLIGAIPIDLFKEFKSVKFTNGYSRTSPSFDIECKGIEIGIGKPEWGAPETPVFIIKLGGINN